MSHAYSEDSLVEQPAIQLFAEMGWQTVSALEEVFGVGGTLGGRPKARRSWFFDFVPRWSALLLLTFE